MAICNPNRVIFTFEDARKIALKSQFKDWELVDEVVLMVNKNMWYSRLNGYQHYKKAFNSGSGFCMQHSLVLKDLLQSRGIESNLVFSLWNEYPTLKHAPHIWLNVKLNDEIRFYCSVFCNKENGKPTFYPKSKVYRFYSWMRIPVGIFATLYNWVYYMVARKH